MAGLMKQNLFYFSFDLKFAEDKHKMSDVLTDKISVKNPFFLLNNKSETEAFRLLKVGPFHRISTEQEGERGGGGSSSLKLNLTDPCCT